MLVGTRVGSGFAKDSLGRSISYTMTIPANTPANLTVLAGQTKSWKDTADQFIRMIGPTMHPDVAMRAYFAETVAATVTSNTQLGVCCQIVAVSLQDELLGVMVNMPLSDKKVSINLLAIAPQHMAGTPGVAQLRGVGTALVAAASRQFLLKGYDTVTLHPFDREAGKFWMARGFMPCPNQYNLCVQGRTAIERLIDGCMTSPECPGDCVLCGQFAGGVAHVRPSVMPLLRGRK